MKADFATRLKAARERRDFSQAALAVKSGMEPSMLSHYEAGSREPGMENFRKLAQALDVTADFLLGLTDETRRLA